jgi:hypothetical protein
MQAAAADGKLSAMWRQAAGPFLASSFPVRTWFL